VNGGQGTVVSRIHRLEHVEGFLPPDFSNDYPVWTHSQRVSDKVSLVDFSFALYIGGPGLQAHHVLLFQLEFSGILDGYNPLILRDEPRHEIEQGRLAAPGAARD